MLNAPTSDSASIVTIWVDISVSTSAFYYSTYNDHENIIKVSDLIRNLFVFCGLFGRSCDLTTFRHPVSAQMKFLMALRLMASNSLQQVIGTYLYIWLCPINSVCCNWQVLKIKTSELNSFINIHINWSWLAAHKKRFHTNSGKYLWITLVHHWTAPSIVFVSKDANTLLWTEKDIRHSMYKLHTIKINGVED